MAGMRRRQSRSGCTGSAKAAGSAMLLAVALVVLLLGCAIPPASAEMKASLAIQPPFDKHDHKGSRIIPYWEKSGSTNIMQTFVRVSSQYASAPCVWVWCDMYRQAAAAAYSLTVQSFRVARTRYIQQVYKSRDTQSSGSVYFFLGCSRGSSGASSGVGCLRSVGGGGSTLDGSAQVARAAEKS